MSGRGAATFAGVLAECWRRPGVLVRELAWRWIYGVLALAVVAIACLHIYRSTSSSLMAAGIGSISVDNLWQSAAITAVVAQILRPVIVVVALWLLPLLALGWVLAAGVGRNVVFRSYERGLPWRPVALCGIQAIRVLALAVTIVLWWGSVRWAASASGVAGTPNLTVYFGLVAVFTLGFLLIWLLFSWVFSIASLFVLIEGRSLGASLWRSFWPGSATGQLVRANLAVGLIRLGLVLNAVILSALPVGYISSPESVWLYAWWAAVTVLYMVVSGFFQVVRLAAFVEFWQPARPGQIQVARRLGDHVN